MSSTHSGSPGVTDLAPAKTPARLDCRICGGPTRRVFDLHSQRHGALVPLFRCTHCDAYFSNGGPVNYDDVDLVWYYLPYRMAIHQRHAKLFACVEGRMNPGRFLDIGAGIGYSLEVATQRGWVARGLEPNRALVRNACERGLNMHHGYLDDACVGEYDFVLADNVLEHVPDPLRFLRNARRLLAPTGMMVVALPPMDWLRKALGTIRYVREKVSRPQLNIFGDADEHVNIMGRRALGELARRAGLQRLPDRFHHSKVFDNAAVRFFGLDDGYHFLTKA